MPGIVAVLLAAGESFRMGQPKPMLPWGDRPLIRYQVESLAEAGAAPIIVVLGPNPADIAPHVRGSDALQTIITPLSRHNKSKVICIIITINHLCYFCFPDIA